MRSASLVVLAMAFSCTTAFAQIEPGSVRVGGNLTKVFDETFNLSGIEGQMGYVARQNLEVGALIGYVHNDLDISSPYSSLPDVGGSLKAGGYLMVHLTPDSRFSPGFFLGASKQFGDFDPFVIDIGGKSDIALGGKALLHVSAGLEWIGEADLIDTPTEWLTTFSQKLLYVRVGIAGLTRKSTISRPPGGDTETSQPRKKPIATFSLSLGYSHSLSAANLFPELTLSNADFSAFLLGGTAALVLTNRVEVGLSIGRTQKTARSEYRDFVEAGTNSAIEQEATWTWVPVFLFTRFYLRERAERIGRFDGGQPYINPFIGVGGGVTRFNLEHSGDFVMSDQTIETGSSSFKVSPPTFVVFAGVEIHLTPTWAISLSGQYSAGKAKISDFSSPEPIDLSAFRMEAGLAARVWR